MQSFGGPFTVKYLLVTWTLSWDWPNFFIVFGPNFGGGANVSVGGNWLGGRFLPPCGRKLKVVPHLRLLRQGKGLLSIYGGYRTANLSNGGAKKVLVLYGKCVKNTAVLYGSQAKKVFVPHMKQMQLVIAYCSWGSGSAVSLPVSPRQCTGGPLESFRVKVIWISRGSISCGCSQELICFNPLWEIDTFWLCFL